MGNLGKTRNCVIRPIKRSASISLAYTEKKWRDKASNEQRERIEWFNVVLYKQAEQFVAT